MPFGTKMGGGEKEREAAQKKGIADQDAPPTNREREIENKIKKECKTTRCASLYRCRLRPSFRFEVEEPNVIVVAPQHLLFRKGTTEGIDKRTKFSYSVKKNMKIPHCHCGSNLKSDE
jgi:hypothetical protein